MDYNINSSANNPFFVPPHLKNSSPEDDDLPPQINNTPSQASSRVLHPELFATQALFEKNCHHLEHLKIEELKAILTSEYEGIPLIHYPHIIEGIAPILLEIGNHAVIIDLLCHKESSLENHTAIKNEQNFKAAIPLLRLLDFNELYSVLSAPRFGNKIPFHDPEVVAETMRFFDVEKGLMKQEEKDKLVLLLIHSDKRAITPLHNLDYRQLATTFPLLRTLTPSQLNILFFSPDKNKEIAYNAFFKEGDDQEKNVTERMYGNYLDFLKSLNTDQCLAMLAGIPDNQTLYEMQSGLLEDDFFDQLIPRDAIANFDVMNFLNDFIEKVNQSKKSNLFMFTFERTYEDQKVLLKDFEETLLSIAKRTLEKDKYDLFVSNMCKTLSPLNMKENFENFNKLGKSPNLERIYAYTCASLCFNFKVSNVFKTKGKFEKPQLDIATHLLPILEILFNTIKVKEGNDSIKNMA